MDPVFKKFSASHVRALVASGELEPDTGLMDMARTPVYRDRRGRWLVLLPPDHEIGMLYESRDGVTSWIRRMDALHRPRPISPAALLGLDDSFLERIDKLVKNVPAVLKTPRLRCDYSVKSVETIDRALRRLEYRALIEPEVVLPLWAYLGEVIRRETGGEWRMLPEQTGERPQPVVTNISRRHIGVCAFFKELHEFSEGGSLTSVVLTSIEYLKRA